MERREFLKGAGAMVLAAASSPLLFRGGRASAGISPVEGKIPFNDTDTLENIRAIIKHNDFRFEVDHNFAYDQYGYAATQSDATPKTIDDPVILPPYPVPQPSPDLPTAFDLRNIDGRSYIGPVRDQGCTGMCPYFGTTSAAEAAYNLRNGLYDENSILLSPMYMKYTAGAGSTENLGTLYSLTKTGMPWSASTGLEGSCREEDYPFTSYDDHMGGCSAPPVNQIAASIDAPRITLRRCAQVYPDNYFETTNLIKAAIFKHGAVVSGIVLSSAIRAYKSGVYEDTWTSPNALPYYASTSNHSIALVGWDDNPPEGGNGGCWILRNSWGPSWGEGGYMRIRYFSAHINCRTSFLEAESPDDGTLKICGKVKVNGKAADSATITLSGDDSFTVIVQDENYGFPALRPGTYRVTPSQPGVVFVPASQEFVLTSLTPLMTVDFSGFN